MESIMITVDMPIKQIGTFTYEAGRSTIIPKAMPKTQLSPFGDD